MAPATVVLDRDGTLLDFYEMFHRFILDLHADAGITPPPREEIVGYPYWTSITSGDLHIGAVRVRDRVDDVVRRYMAHGTLYAGTVEMLTALAAAGVRLVLVSSWIGTVETRELLRGQGVAGCFGAVLTRDDLAGAAGGMSDADVKVALAGRALVEVGHRGGERLFVVGDTAADVALGRRLGGGAVVVGVRTGNGRMFEGAVRGVGGGEGPDVLLPSVAGLASLVLGGDGGSAWGNPAPKGSPLPPPPSPLPPPKGSP
ncbi:MULTISPECIES: HAD family hydrolase [unclassified Streptomyces]|uniref:HAD family hydrolase n=1 Tax=unclassified Streptomyces TaxID=2593676 RepID=UPI00381BBFC9